MRRLSLCYCRPSTGMLSRHNRERKSLVLVTLIPKQIKHVNCYGIGIRVQDQGLA